MPCLINSQSLFSALFVGVCFHIIKFKTLLERFALDKILYVDADEQTQLPQVYVQQTLHLQTTWGIGYMKLVN